MTLPENSKLLPSGPNKSFVQLWKLLRQSSYDMTLWSWNREWKLMAHLISSKKKKKKNVKKEPETPSLALAIAIAQLHWHQMFSAHAYVSCKSWPHSLWNGCFIGRLSAMYEAMYSVGNKNHWNLTAWSLLPGRFGGLESCEPLAAIFAVVLV